MSYCDSTQYAENVHLVQYNQFFNFVSQIVKYGLKSLTYSERANLIINRMDINLQALEYEITLAVCDTTVGHVLKTMMDDFPTAIELTTCTNNTCPNSKHTTRDIMFITYQVSTSNSIEGLQLFMDRRVEGETVKCENCTSSITTKLSQMHLFIDVLLWEGKGEYSYIYYK